MGAFGTLPVGDVLGPNGATDNAVVRFDGTSGKLIQNSVGILTDAGEFQAGNGAVGTPAFSFTGDPDTGMYWPGAGAISWAINGTQYMQLANNVIRLFTAGARLGNGTPGAGLSLSGQQSSLLTPGVTIDNFSSAFSAAGAGQQRLLRVEATVNQVASTAGFTAFEMDITQTSLGSGSQLLADWKLGGTSQLIVTAGTTAPGRIRAVDGAVATPTYSFLSDTDTGHWWISTGLSAFGGDGLEVMRVSAPAGANPQILLADGTGARPSYSFTADTGLGFYRSSANTVTFVTGGATRMSFATGGITLAAGSETIAATGGGTMVLRPSSTTGAGPSLRFENLNNYTGSAAATQVASSFHYVQNQSGTAGFTAVKIRITQTTLGSGYSAAIDSTINDVSMFSVAVKGAVAFTPGSPAAMAATENDYNGAGFTDVTFVRMTGNAANTVVTGFQAPGVIPVGGVAAAQFKILVNIAAPTITINHQDAGSAAANRVITSTGAAVVLNQDDTMMMIYDSTTARWRQITAIA